MLGLFDGGGHLDDHSPHPWNQQGSIHSGSRRGSWRTTRNGQGYLARGNAGRVSHALRNSGQGFQTGTNAAQNDGILIKAGIVGGWGAACRECQAAGRFLLNNSRRNQNRKGRINRFDRWLSLLRLGCRNLLLSRFLNHLWGLWSLRSLNRLLSFWPGLRRDDLFGLRLKGRSRRREGSVFRARGKEEHPTDANRKEQEQGTSRLHDSSRRMNCAAFQLSRSQLSWFFMAPSCFGPFQTH